MTYRISIGAIALTAALLVPLAGTRAHDEAKYPDWSGIWNRDPGPPRYDPSKPGRRGQQPPLTPEYQAIFEASLKDQEQGGQGNDTTHRCIPVGMPRQASSGFPVEIVITTKATYILFEILVFLAAQNSHRRARLAEGRRADLHGLFDRQMDRYRWRWPLRHAGDRDPQHEGASPGR